MNDNKLKDIWSKAENFRDTPGYESDTIERFLTSRSNSIAEKITRMLQFDIAIKLLAAIVFTINAILYFNIQSIVFTTCLSGAALIIPFVLFELRILRQFSGISDYGQSTKAKLSAMLTFLRSRFFIAILSISSTNLFFFYSGLLFYFFIVYGHLRQLDNMDIFVFSILCIIGIVMNFVINYTQVRYHIKHLEACLSDLNDSVLSVVSINIETQQKQDRTIKLLLGVALILGFVLLIAILKKIGM
ncbi:MAG TPA: hypothetical protein DCR40_06975 [Prolixibacteraceae bacterium]|nr:hypothetical protein [Prolixibacteraceae bacterium]